MTALDPDTRSNLALAAGVIGTYAPDIELQYHPAHYELRVGLAALPLPPAMEPDRRQRDAYQWAALDTRPEAIDSPDPQAWHLVLTGGYRLRFVRGDQVPRRGCVLGRVNYVSRAL